VIGRTNATGNHAGEQIYRGRWAYSGAHTVSYPTLQGKQKTLVTVTSSGILQIMGELLADIWMIGGGGAGHMGRYGSTGGYAGGGGAGGYTNWILSMVLSGEFALTIGAGGITGSYSGTTITTAPAAGGQTRFGDLWIANGGNPGNQQSGGTGGSGGGNGGSANGGAGDRKTTCPWNGEIAGVGFQGGGGTGGIWTVNGTPNTGAEGGSNGANGGTGRGIFGYGSNGRGGNGGSSQNSSSSYSRGTDGSQGLIYLLIDGEFPEGL